MTTTIEAAAHPRRALRRPAGLSVRAALPRGPARLRAACACTTSTSGRPRRQRPHRAVPARPADLELPVPQDDPGVHRGRASRRGAGLLRLRPLRQAGGRRRLHLQLPPRDADALRRGARPRARDAGGAGLGRPARPHAADGVSRTHRPADRDEHRPRRRAARPARASTPGRPSSPRRPDFDDRRADEALGPGPTTPRPPPTTRRSRTRRYRAGVRRFPALVPVSPDMDGVDDSRRARAVLPRAVERADASWRSACRTRCSARR